MHFLILLLLLLALVFGPQLYVKSVLKRYSVPHERFPGTGGELARHLLDRFDMHEVGVEATETGDHYDPVSRKVRLTQDKIDGKSLTAIAVAAHEVGHAIQHHKGYPMFEVRSRMVKLATVAQKVGAGAMFAIPVLTLLTRVPSVGMLTLALGVFSFLGATLVHLATLPVELDASFGRALPILKQGEYINASEEKSVRKILRAAAWTYVAASLASLLNLGRWWALLRR
ncbi:MAG: zinc metallopeptidase [Gammaproteobacteria bacterium]|nr:zinc metallopeptidase [Gammaproteobacteria bacterium]